VLKTIISTIGILIATLFGAHQAHPILSVPKQTAVVSQALNKAPTGKLPAASSAGSRPGIVLGASTTAISYVTKDQLAEAIANLSAAFAAQLPNTAATPQQVAAGGNSANPYAAGQRIDRLTNVTVNGVSGLTAGDIPTNITASNYLPLSGGALTGTLYVPSLNASSTSYDSFIATNSTTTNATTTNLAVTGTASTSNLVASNSFILGTLTGFLKATGSCLR